ncbi:MtrAB system accessory lipoprotein LpqB [Corynebacterium pygosceleis]|uniref:Lipoprotein LpqB n=1 Tax=Corynebacterium pygosceleis TaxID=2800406 RepID=A0A9Q4C7F5_9CORY|nr:MtrAB system accessory lipoprotein LpqB [Corynebacterium pygosceleis]MCK7637706.1 MtrAB system accessory lipoprotein LpqB [Corynebacterium pygosceleis]MCK7674897.1 MtrAB system accessory lipoprotein LpqB [Corynebacterium pygosceleis]MCL0119514.1 MtrAB system accessory lipoprotein LpqB [Corynebacterium pygosceleis]MCX7444754.1 MtrAB system accessory lipoprotein LpqB [Corynebacterium pygosceleis]MCX7467965.1 MtrAB system accessory lipoprotein LpqB [Corynebacterium pygosceleis]
MKRRPLRALGALLLVPALVTGCTSLPGDSAPQAIRAFEPSHPTEDELAPVPGQEPDLLLRGFFTAAGNPAQKHQAARAFLTDPTASSWDDTAGTLILDRIDLNAEPGATEDSISYKVRGTVVGTLGTGGVYTPENGEYEATMELNRVGGEWRISALPPGVVLERTELRNKFSPYDLFFFAPTGKFLVRDRRWVYNGQPSLDTALLSLLMEGPQYDLAPGVVDEIPPEAVFTGTEGGVYHFTGFGDLDIDQRHRFAAQVVWTLAHAGARGPYRVELDGTPIDPGHEALTVEDVAEFNPNAFAGTISPLYALNEGSLMLVDGTDARPVAGPLGTAGNIASAEISSSGGVVAAVETPDGVGDPGKTGAPRSGERGKSRLLLGPVGGQTTEVLSAGTLTRPSFEYEATALWTVLDGRTVARVARSTSTGELSQVEVDASTLDEPDHGGDEQLISVLRLSPDGVRVAMIRGGRVWVGTVARPAPGERKIVRPVEIAPAIGDTALALSWQQDGSLLVGTSSPDTPVWRVEVDGSAVTSLPTGNLMAPIVAVASSSNTLYATDARAMLQLPASTNSAAFWREVPALQGTRAVPVVAD